MTFDFDPATREQIFAKLLPALEHYYENTKPLSVSSDWNISEIREFAQKFKLDSGNKADEILNHVLKGLTDFAVQTPHPNYFGLFNPRPAFTSVIADFISANFKEGEALGNITDNLN